MSLNKPYIVFPSIFQNIFYSETNKPIDFKVHVETPGVDGSEFITNVNGHMSKIATMLI